MCILPMPDNYNRKQS
uniref:Uncharacterized protein n=1 Tax=Rhizophora mucronata TaxID=61149 RepID=A0A2P2R4L2_RHIMU